MSEERYSSGNAAVCQRPFEESLLTGYVDRVLTQEEEQRVRLHLEDCGACRAMVEDLQTMRKATMSTEFNVPDEQWLESPRGPSSALALGAGWLVVVVWGVGIAGFALGALWQGTQSLIEKLVIFGGVSGFALLFVSVAIDRLRSRRTDRYRRVVK